MARQAEIKNYYKDSVKIMKVNIEKILSVFNEFYKMTLKDELDRQYENALTDS